MKKIPDSILVIRVDASYNIGIGHVRRCASLAENFVQEGLEVHFICRRLPGDGISFLKKKHFVVHEIDDTSDEIFWERDLEATVNVLKGLRPVDFLIVDHYGLGSDWESACRAFVPKIIAIDDLGNRKHDCDILLDQNIGRVEKDYSACVPKNCRLLLGPGYALLSKQYYKMRNASIERRNTTHSVKNILVSMGGTDPNNATELTLDALSKMPETIRVSIVLGASMRHRESVIEKAKRLSRAFNMLLDVDNLPELMVGSDIAIGAGGVTSYERCCLGLPTVVISIADNQLQTVTHLQKTGAIDYLGAAESVSSSQLLRAVQQLIAQPISLQKMSSVAYGVCDGRGVDRVVSEVLQ